jgi:hypothetical protein
MRPEEKRAVNSVLSWIMDPAGGCSDCTPFHEHPSHQMPALHEAGCGALRSINELLAIMGEPPLEGYKP